MGRLQLSLNNTVSAAVKNIDELLPNFSYDGYNISEFADEFFPEFVCTGGDDDGVNFVNLWERDGKFFEKIPAPIFDNAGFRLEGSVRLGHQGNTYRTNPTIYKLKWERSELGFGQESNGMLLKSFLTQEDYVRTRYVRRGIPDYMETVMLAITLFMMVKEGIEQGIRTYNAIKDAIPRSTTDVGVIVVGILNALVELIYFAAIIIAIGALMKAISEALFAKPKAYFALDVLTVFQKGCEKLGYEFSSSILEDSRYEGLTWLVSTTEGGELTKTPKNDPVPDISFMDFIDRFSNLLNLKPRVSGRVFSLEDAKTYEASPVDVELTDLYNSGDVSYNNFEIPRGISVAYQTDASDQHIKENKASLLYSVNDRDNGIELQEIIKNEFSFGRAQRKNKQDDSEKFFNSIFDAFAGINKNYKVKNGDRIGFMLLNSDVVPIDLVYIRDGEKIKNTTDLDADQIIQTRFREEGPDRNQWMTVEGRDKDPLCTQNDFLKLAYNNVCYDTKRRTIVVQSNQYNTTQGTYELSYKKRLQAGDFGYVSPDRITVELAYGKEDELVREIL